jgi:hypothetical protein
MHRERDPLGRATATIRVLAADGPFKVGDDFDLANPGRDEHFHGVIVTVVPVDDEWLQIEVEYPAAEWEAPEHGA